MRDEVVLTHESERGLVGVVESSAADFAVQPCRLLGDLAAAVRSALAPGERLLCGFELRGDLLAVTGVGHELALPATARC